MNRIDNSFAKLRDKNKKALIPFVTFGAGLSVNETIDLVVKMGEKGAAVVEIGVPFSDPLADGPVIQNAYMEKIHTPCRVIMRKLRALYSYKIRLEN